MIFGVKICIYDEGFAKAKGVAGSMTVEMIKVLGLEYLPPEKHADALEALEQNKLFSHVWDTGGIESRFRFWPQI